MKIRKEKNMLRLSLPYNKDMIDHCMSIGMKWSKARRDWYFKNNYMNRLNLSREFPESFHIDKSPAREPIIPDYLMEHQKQGLIDASMNDRYGIFFDTGSGKSLLTLEIIKHYGEKTLIVCPLSLIEGAWIPEVKNWHPDLQISNLWVAKKNGKDALNLALKKDICVINYESFRTIDKELAKVGFNMVILDESARIKSSKSSTTKKIIEFCDNVQYVYLLSGVPAPNSVQDYWSQVRILNPVLWGQSFYNFRKKYFYQYGYGGFKWELKNEYKDKIVKDINTVATYVNKDDVLDLPERTDSLRVFPLSQKEMKHYKEMKKKLITILDEDVEVVTQSAVASIMKLRQISSGFLMDEDKVFEIGNSKIKEFIALVEDIGTKQVIVWINFKHEAMQIANALKKMGHDSGILNSTVTENQKQEYLKRFKAGDLQYIICHPKSVGYGHTLINCSEAIYYSSSYSYDDAYQSKDRIYRKGQTKKCSYYYLIADKTLDKTILNAVQSKEDVSLAILEHLKDETSNL